MFRNTVNAMFKEMQINSLENIRLSALRDTLLPRLMSGELDPCRGTDAQFRKAVRLLSEVGYPNVTAQVYPGMRHEIHNETGRQRVWDDLLHFINTTLNVQ